MGNANTAWALIAHGGAKNRIRDEEESNRAGLVQALEIGRNILSEGGSALDTVEMVVKSLELNPAYNAGLFGSVLNEEGEMELDASIMDGKTLQIGAVAGVQNIEHPVSVARQLLSEKAIFLVGKGAEKYAKSHGFTASEDPIPAKNSSGCDTVGCVALDTHGSMAVATSTGGLSGAKVGRVGDVPLPGCGFYADNTRGGISLSGEGETIARVMLASEFLHMLKDMNPDQAASNALKLLERVDGEAGLIAITPQGEICWDHNSPYFVVGYMRAGDKNPAVFLKKSEEYESR
jgi:beta-aspartyl-peptidase (threonine type)